MLYLLEPTLTTQWNNLPDSMLDLFKEHGADLGELDWEPAEGRVDRQLLALALRRGTPCSRGIAVDGGDVYALGWGERIRTSHANTEAAQAAIPQANEDLMDRLIPGWKAHGEDLNRRIAEQSAKSAKRADLQAMELLDGDPDPALLAHWTRLGGPDLTANPGR